METEESIGEVIELAELLRSIYGGKILYQEIEHPHFDGWTVTRPSRFESIWRTCVSLLATSGTHIDVGSNTGGVCRSFSRYGFQSTGFDTDERCIDISNLANRVIPGLQSPPSFICGEWDGQECDVMTCLSVFHSFHNKPLGPRLPEIHRAMADASRVFITDCVVVPSYDCKVWTVDDFATWLREATGKQVYLIGGTDVRPLFVATDLPVMRNLTEDFVALKTFVLSAFDEVNVPKMRVGNDTYSCWPGSEVRKALEDLGVAWEATPMLDSEFADATAKIDLRVDAIWPGCTKVLLEYDHRRAPKPHRDRLDRLNSIARELLGWPVVRIVDRAPDASDVWCHYALDVRREAWENIVSIEGGAS